MKKIKLLKVLLYCLDAVLVIVAIGVVFNFLFSEDKSIKNILNDLPKNDESILKDYQEPPVKKDFYDLSFYGVISQLPNPIEIKESQKGTSITNLPVLAKFIEIQGTMPNAKDPKMATVFIKLKNNGKTVMVSYGEPILDENGKEIPELQGVKLVEVYFDVVVFDNNGKREELKISDTESAVATADMVPDNQPPFGRPLYRRHPGDRRFPENQGTPTKKQGDIVIPVSPNPETLPYNSKLVEDMPNKQVWDIDYQEMLWANANQDKIMGQATLSVYSGGGIKINAIQPNSILQQRGFMPGDVVKSINGTPLNSIADIQNVISILKTQGIQEVTVTVNRAGRDVAITYRLPK